jgi:hypothetical protein
LICAGSELLTLSRLKITHSYDSLSLETKMPTTYEQMYEKMLYAPGFVAALDQSGGSTPKALKLYGIPDDAYIVVSSLLYLF